MFRDIIIKRALIVFIMFAVMNIILGCEKQISVTPSISNQDRNLLLTPEPDGDFYVVDLPTNRVFLSSFQYDTLKGTISFKYHYLTNNNQRNFRELILSKISGDKVGFEIIISDSEGNMLLTWSIEVDTLNSTSQMIEKTPQDSLVIIHSAYIDYIYEEYNYNGSVYTVEFTENELNQFNEWYNQADKLDNPEFDKFTAFLDYYPAISSLNNNIDGEVLIYLFDDDTFLNWLESGLGYFKEKPEIKTATVDDICKIACAAATVKCLWGGFFLNFICHAAVGTCTACVIYWIIDLIL